MTHAELNKLVNRLFAAGLRGESLGDGFRMLRGWVRHGMDPDTAAYLVSAYLVGCGVRR